MGGSQKVVSDGTVGDKVVQDTMSPKNVPAPEAGGGVIDKAHDQKKAEKPEDDPKSKSGVISAVVAFSAGTWGADSKYAKDEVDEESFLSFGEVNELDDLLDRQDNGEDIDEDRLY